MVIPLILHRGFLFEACLEMTLCRGEYRCLWRFTGHDLRLSCFDIAWPVAEPSIPQLVNFMSRYAGKFCIQSCLRGEWTLLDLAWADIWARIPWCEPKFALRFAKGVMFLENAIHIFGGSFAYESLEWSLLNLTMKLLNPLLISGCDT